VGSICRDRFKQAVKYHQLQDVEMSAVHTCSCACPAAIRQRAHEDPRLDLLASRARPNASTRILFLDGETAVRYFARKRDPAKFAPAARRRNNTDALRPQQSCAGTPVAVPRFVSRPPFCHMNDHNLTSHKPMHFDRSPVAVQPPYQRTTHPCQVLRTDPKQTRVFGLKALYEPGVQYEFYLESRDAAGKRRCAGGDVYEVMLYSGTYRQRCPVTDHRNGSYTVDVSVRDPSFFGGLSVRVDLLFDNGHDMDESYDVWTHNFLWAVAEQVPNSPFSIMVCKGCDADAVHAHTRYVHVPQRFCSVTPTKRRKGAAAADAKHSFPFTPAEPGYWTRLDVGVACHETPHCLRGSPPGRSEGWVYSPARCKLRMFSVRDAWRCLDKKWLYVAGDSTTVQTLANMVSGFLGVRHPLLDSVKDGAFPTAFSNPFSTSVLSLNKAGAGRNDDAREPPGRRNFDIIYKKPRRHSIPAATFRVTHVYNGHPTDDALGDMGLLSYRFPEHRAKYSNVVDRAWPGRVPSLVLATSGINDAGFLASDFVDRQKHLSGMDELTFLKANVREFARHMAELRANMSAAGAVVPPLVWRNNPAASGLARLKVVNPGRMDRYNQVVHDALKRDSSAWPDYINWYDMTYPFHFDIKFR
jgi:hypothetical protein